jgi:uncharacterized protein YacL
MEACITATRQTSGGRMVFARPAAARTAGNA